MKITFDENIFNETLKEEKIVKYIPHFKNFIKTYIKIHNLKTDEISQNTK